MSGTGSASGRRAGAEGSPESSTYIRAGGGVPVNTRTLAGVLVWLFVAGSLGLALYFAVSAAGQDSRLTLLREKGVAVQATVTGCTAVSSGVGMGIEYWNCRASYAVGGHDFTAPLGGNRKLLDAGTVLPAVAVPGHPDLLWTAAGLQRGHSSAAGYTIAGVLAGAGLAAGGARVCVGRRRRRRRVAG